MSGFIAIVKHKETGNTLRAIAMRSMMHPHVVADELPDIAEGKVHFVQGFLQANAL
jgi:hypothetical protein